jgi:hypothetical protein
MTMELDAEMRFSAPIAATVKAVARIRAEGHRVIFISDTYFSHAFVMGLLEQAGVEVMAADLYVSSVHRQTKDRGGLYRLVQQELGRIPVSHLGDNAHADVERARQYGWVPRHFTRGAPTAHERSMMSLTGPSRAVLSAVAGSARTSRLERYHEDPRLDTIRAVAAGVAGPLLTAFVMWVLEESRRQGIRRLYFCARDGQVLFRLAPHCAAILGIGIEFRYIYASRQAWHLPSIGVVDSKVLNWLFDAPDGKSLRDILRRVDLVPEDCRQVLESLGFSPVEWDNPLDSGGLSRLIAAVQKANLQDLIVEKARRARELVLEYLRDEAMLDADVPFAMVDIGWNGRLQRSLSKILAYSTHGKAPVRGFYFALSDCPPVEDNNHFHAFIARSDAGELTRCVHAQRYLVEVFFYADHPSLLGFERSAGGRVVPRFSAADHTDIAAIQCQQDGIEGFAHRLKNASLALEFAGLARGGAELERLRGDIMQATKLAGARGFIRTSSRPTDAESRAYGTFVNDYWGFGEMAPPLRFMASLRCLFSRPNSLLSRTVWLEGSITRGSPLFIRAPLLMLATCRHIIAEYVRNRLIRLRRSRGR